MKCRQMIAVCSSFFIVAVQSGIVNATPLTDATAQMTNDSMQISQWMSDQLKIAVPYNSTTGAVVPKQLKIFGVELGVEGAISSTKVDVDAFHNLPTTLVDTRSITMYSRLPMPAVMGHAKFGLPFGLDAGIRVGGIPTQSFDNGTSHFDVRNSILGFDIRKVLIEEGITRPFGLTVGTNFTRAKGSMDFNTTYDAKSIASGGNAVTLNNGDVSSHSDWDTKSVGFQVILNKQLLMFNPYIGASTNKNFGSVNTTVTNSGTVEVNSVDDGLVTTSGTGTATPNQWDTRALAGIEISILPFVRLGIQGEFAGANKLGGDIGLRAQFR